jgi:hypothetical protein
MDEFSPIKHLSNLLKLWWIPVITALLGGFAGNLFHTRHLPIYEASASFYVTLDFNKIGVSPLTQYDEDVALAVTQGVLQSDEVLKSVTAETQAQGLRIDLPTLDLYTNKDISIERLHAFWYIRYRNIDAVTAKKIVNIWAQKGYETMLAWQARGAAQPYVVFSPPTLAKLPTQPILYGENKLILAGGLIGFIIGLLLLEIFSSRVFSPDQIKAAGKV